MSSERPSFFSTTLTDTLNLSTGHQIPRPTHLKIDTGLTPAPCPARPNPDVGRDEEAGLLWPLQTQGPGGTEAGCRGVSRKG